MILIVAPGQCKQERVARLAWCWFSHYWMRSSQITRRRGFTHPILGLSQGHLIYANENGGLWRQKTRKFMTNGQLQIRFTLWAISNMTLGSQSMKQNVSSSQTLDHKETTKATGIEEEKNKSSRDKMSGWPEAKCMTDPNSLHYFSVGKFQ